MSLNAERQRNHPSRIWYAIGAALFFVGILGGPGWLVIKLVSGFSSGEYFLAPGTKVFNLDQSGKYVIWHAAKSFFQGKSYVSPSELPDGATIKVTDNRTQEALVLTPSMGGKESSGHHEKYAICTFRVEAPGEYTIAVDKLSSQKVLMLRKSQAIGVLIALLQSTLIGFAGMIGGPGLVVFVAIRRQKETEVKR